MSPTPRRPKPLPEGTPSLRARILAEITARPQDMYELQRTCAAKFYTLRTLLTQMYHRGDIAPVDHRTGLHGRPRPIWGPAVPALPRLKQVPISESGPAVVYLEDGELLEVPLGARQVQLHYRFPMPPALASPLLMGADPEAYLGSE